MRKLLVLAISLISVAVFADDSSTTEMLKKGKAVYSQTCVACKSCVSVSSHRIRILEAV